MTVKPLPAEAFEPIPLEIPAGVPLNREPDDSIRVNGTRVHFWMVARMLDAGATSAEVLERFPALRANHLKAVAEFRDCHRAEVDAYLARLEEQEAIIEKHTRDEPLQLKFERLLAERNVQVPG